MAKLSGLVVTVAFSQLSWLFMNLQGFFPSFSKRENLLPCSILVLGTNVFLLRKLLPASAVAKDANPNILARGLLYHACCLFCFSSVVDLIFYLEIIGVVKGIIGFYLQTGEKYFDHPYGTVVLLWDFIGNFPLQLTIIYYIDNGKDCRNVVLYWGATMFTSLCTLITGALSGSFSSDIMPASWLNLPYFLIPTHYLMKFMMQPRYEPQRALKRENSMIDVILTICLAFGFLFGFIRGLAGLNSKLPLANYYVQNFEPYILDPSNFGGIWVLLMLFVGSLLQIILMHGLFMKNAIWVLDWCIIYTAVTIYGTYFHLTAQFCPALKESYKIPATNQFYVVALNLFVPLTALAVQYRMFQHRKPKTL